MSSLLKNPMYIHIACEAVIIGSLFYIMNKRVSLLQKDLNECVARIGKQTARMAELEETIQTMASNMDILSNIVMRPQPMYQAPAPTPAPVSAPKVAKAPSKTPEPAKTPESDAPSKAFITEIPEETKEPFQHEGGSEATRDLDTQIADELRELESSN